MQTHRTRAASPQGPRIFVDSQPRASTGVISNSSYDPRYEQRSVRSSMSSIPSTAATSTSSRHTGLAYDTQPVKKSFHHDPSNPGAATTRTEYVVRPRRDSDTRRPLGVVAKNVSPTRDYAEPAHDMVVYKQPRDDASSRLLQPHSRGSAHHQRHNSATRAEIDRTFKAVGAPRVDREYHKRGPYNEKVADSRPPASSRYVEQPAYEYTGPREQFDRDYPVRTKRESLPRRERPTSAVGTKFEPAPSRRDTAPPPAASRALQRIEQDDRRTGFESDPDRSRDYRRSRQSLKGPVVHQREDGYSSARDEYDLRRQTGRPYNDDAAISGSKNVYHDSNMDRDRDRARRERYREEERPRERERDKDREREREREKPERRSERTGEREYQREREKPRPRDYEALEEDDHRSGRRRRDPREKRDESPDRSKLGALATAAIGGLTATGIANFGKSRKDGDASDSDSKKERRRRRHRSQDRKEADKPEDENTEERRRRRRERRTEKADSSGSDTPDEDTSQRRPHSRTRNRRETQDGYGSEREKRATQDPGPERRPAREVDSDVVRGESTREFLDRSQQASPVDHEGRALSPGEDANGRPRRVSIVEPLKDKKEDLRPRGILKPPRMDPFPEDPNPTREGVAPLKQAGKDGIPSGARWTKVSRILVNPEALEKAQERFEERDDYVIVLRVLTREEIQKLAELTRGIRDSRERERQKEIAERRRIRIERGQTGTEEDENDQEGASADTRSEPLAIEAPPSDPPVDLRQYAAQNAAQQQAQQGYDPQSAYAPRAYPPQQAPQQQQQSQPQQQQWQMPQGQQYYQQPYQPPQQQWAPGQWNNAGNARESAEAIANTAPGQPLPPKQGQGQGQGQMDPSMYSQNV